MERNIHLQQAVQAIYDKKGFNILVLDLRPLSSTQEFCIIAEGNVDRHVRALSQYLVDEMKKLDLPPLLIEGEKQGDWVAIDFGSFTVHLFTHEMRTKYKLESLWKDAKIVDVEIKTAESLGERDG